MKKWIKRLAIGILAVLLLAITFEAVLAIKNPFLWGFWKTYIPSLFARTTPEWKNYIAPDGRLSLDSPFPMKWEKSASIKNGKGYEDIKGELQHNRTGFSMFIISGRYINLKKKNPSFDRLLVFNKQAFQNEANFKWNEELVTCSSRPATLATYSSDIGGNSLHHLQLVVNDDNESWDISIDTYQKDLDSYNEWSKRIIQSIKILPNSQSSPSK